MRNLRPTDTPDLAGLQLSWIRFLGSVTEAEMLARWTTLPSDGPAYVERNVSWNAGHGPGLGGAGGHLPQIRAASVYASKGEGTEGEERLVYFGSRANGGNSGTSPTALCRPSVGVCRR